MPLIAANDFDGLPDEPIARWLQLRDLVEKRLDSFGEYSEGRNSTHDLLEYTQVLSAAADELGVGSFPEISPGNISEEFSMFRARVAGLATRLSLRSGIVSASNSVTLARPTRKRILIEIETLRSLIRNSDISDAQKNKATGKIDQLQILIVASRTDIARIGLLLVGIGAFAAGTTSFLADIPNAIGTISALIGADKLEEEDDQRLIESARSELQIEDLRATSGDPNDDEIPF